MVVLVTVPAGDTLVRVMGEPVRRPVMRASAFSWEPAKVTKSAANRLVTWAGSRASSLSRRAAWVVRVVSSCPAATAPVLATTG
jgi:hypothetical protein